MKLLILGGTLFLGRYLTEAALARGHEVTLFNRGRSGPDLFPEAERLRGDRDGGLAPLEGRTWDAVIDTSGYLPRVVRQSARLLEGQVAHYTFISSISVYREVHVPWQDEEAPLATVEDETTEDIQKHYGALKALCEREVRQAFGEARTLIIRPGLIVGPHDLSDRFGYWPARIARGGEVLAPGRKEQPVQIIDVRDLAAWTLRMVEARQSGTYNATGPERPLTMERLLQTCCSVIGSDARLTWVDEPFLLEQKVGPWMEIPLWLPGNAADGMLQTSIDRALRQGLTFRPLEQTIRDTLAWEQSLPPDRKRRAGLAPEREAELLRAWHSRREGGGPATER